MENYIFLSIGLILLIASGNFLVDGSVSLARHFKVSTLVIGVVIVSFGTSAPELLVSLQAALRGHADISIGNVIGSNISNIALVLGITALMFPIIVSKKIMRLDYPFLIFSSFLLLYFLSDGELLTYEGIVLFILLIVYLVYTIFKSRRETKQKKEKSTEPPKLSIAISFAIVIISSIGLIFGARWLVESASRIALDWGVSERIISLTIVAFGTSVPELAASIVGMVKKEADISIGNIIGSNLFNILGILGISAIISPIHNINSGLFHIDIYWMLGLTIGLLILIVLPFNRFKISRLKGGLLFSTYLIYIILLFL